MEQLDGAKAFGIDVVIPSRDSEFPAGKGVIFLFPSAYPGAKLVYVQYIICGVCVCVFVCTHTCSNPYHGTRIHTHAYLHQSMNIT